MGFGEQRYFYSRASAAPSSAASPAAAAATNRRCHESRRGAHERALLDERIRDVEGLAAGRALRLGVRENDSLVAVPSVQTSLAVPYDRESVRRGARSYGLRRSGRHAPLRGHVTPFLLTPTEYEVLGT